MNFNLGNFLRIIFACFNYSKLFNISSVLVFHYFFHFFQKNFLYKNFWSFILLNFFFFKKKKKKNKKTNM